MNPGQEYFAVIFSSQLSGSDIEGYEEMAERMEELATTQEGYLGIESARGDRGFGISVSYWKDERSISAWKKNAEHLLAQHLGKEKWYRKYSLRIAKVSREYHFPKG